jgi:hypothetical protein
MLRGRAPKAPPRAPYRTPDLIEGFFATIMVEILEHRANDGAGILKDFSEKVAAHARRFKAKTRDPELQKQFDEIAERTIANANERGIDELFRRTMK